MKFGIFFLIGLCFISASALGELSVDDVEKIRGIFKESEERLRAELVASEERLRAELLASEERVRAELVASEERLRAEIALVRAENAASETRTNKQLDRNFTLLVALFGFVAVVTGIPLTLVALQLRKERDRDEQLNQQRREIDAQRQLIETLQQQLAGINHELETLKQQRIFK